MKARHLVAQQLDVQGVPAVETETGMQLGVLWVLPEAS
jgi:hypothetical protein